MSMSKPSSANLLNIIILSAVSLGITLTLAAFIMLPYDINIVSQKAPTIYWQHIWNLERCNINLISWLKETQCSYDLLNTWEIEDDLGKWH